MTLAEFKTWFEGFTENMKGVPNNKQWKRVCERVAEIDGSHITERIFIDRWGPYRPYWPTGIEWWAATNSKIPGTIVGDSGTVEEIPNVQINLDQLLANAGRAEYTAMQVENGILDRAHT